jgi:ubiquinol-cytochrome c reductase subunit 7
MVMLHHTHLPVAEQNYDPMIPYMAPYIEEAKHQIQEEIELLQFHPWERRLYSGDVSGFGETDKNANFLSW